MRNPGAAFPAFIYVVRLEHHEIAPALLAPPACPILPALGDSAEIPETGLRTETITFNGQTCTIEANANLSEADPMAITIGEPEARFTEGRIRALSADYAMAPDAAGAVQIQICSFGFNDLLTSAPRAMNLQSVSVIDGKIRLELASLDDTAFFWFSLQ
jgi:hypothetical protein